MSESFAARARNMMLFATGIVCQVLPESKERRSAPSGDKVHLGVALFKARRSSTLRATLHLSGLGLNCHHFAAAFHGVIEIFIPLFGWFLRISKF